MKLPHVVAAMLGGCLASIAFAVGEPEPLWAYGYATPPPPGTKPATGSPTPGRALRPNEDQAEQTKKRRIEGSTQEFSLAEVRTGNDVVDWFPGDHPAMTPLMKRGPASLGGNAFGCAYCHMPNGKGRPENAPVFGLPPAYFVRQLQDFRDGHRASADPRKSNTAIMSALAKAMTDAEMKEAADYFAAIPWTPWIRVVETDRVPKTRIGGGMFLPTEKEFTEPIGARIIEAPEDVEQTEQLRNPRSGFVAYVPVGSLKAGEALVTTGGASVVDGKIVPGKTFACGTCHGPDLNGFAEIPAIAGRSPSYIVRQLYDMQQGTRKTPLSQLMQPVVANLTNDDFVAIAAYVSSRVPKK